MPTGEHLQYFMNTKCVCDFGCRNTPSPVVVPAVRSPIALPNTPKGKVENRFINTV